ncbi:hypothetical protein WDW89_22880 [Deltaproteobacteria bacterium TL4]
MTTTKAIDEQLETDLMLKKATDQYEKATDKETILTAIAETILGKERVQQYQQDYDQFVKTAQTISDVWTKINDPKTGPELKDAVIDVFKNELLKKVMIPELQINEITGMIRQAQEWKVVFDEYTSGNPEIIKEILTKTRDKAQGDYSDVVKTFLETHRDFETTINSIQAIPTEIDALMNKATDWEVLLETVKDEIVSEAVSQLTEHQEFLSNLLSHADQAQTILKDFEEKVQDYDFLQKVVDPDKEVSGEEMYNFLKRRVVNNSATLKAVIGITENLVEGQEVDSDDVFNLILTGIATAAGSVIISGPLAPLVNYQVAKTTFEVGQKFISSVQGTFQSLVTDFQAWYHAVEADASTSYEEAMETLFGYDETGNQAILTQNFDESLNQQGNDHGTVHLLPPSDFSDRKVVEIFAPFKGELIYAQLETQAPEIKDKRSKVVIYRKEDNTYHVFSFNALGNGLAVGKVLEKGFSLGIQATNEELKYEIYGVGTPLNPPHTGFENWAKWDPESYWNEGELKLEFFEVDKNGEILDEHGIHPSQTAYLDENEISRYVIQPNVKNSKEITLTVTQMGSSVTFNLPSSLTIPASDSSGIGHSQIIEMQVTPDSNISDDFGTIQIVEAFNSQIVLQGLESEGEQAEDFEPNGTAETLLNQPGILDILLNQGQESTVQNWVDNEKLFIENATNYFTERGETTQEVYDSKYLGEYLFAYNSGDKFSELQFLLESGVFKLQSETGLEMLAKSSNANEILEENQRLLKIGQEALEYAETNEILITGDFKQEIENLETSVHNFGLQIGTTISDDVFSDLSPWQKMKEILLGGNKGKEIRDFITPDSSNPDGIYAEIAIGTVAPHQKFFSPLDGELQLVTESSVWIRQTDGSIHHFGHIDVPDSLIQKYKIFKESNGQMERPTIHYGELMGESLSKDEPMTLAIHALGDPNADVSTWPKWNARDYWEGGGLGLEVVTAKGSEGVAIEEGGQEQLTFRLKVGHTGEIKLKLRFNDEGTAEADQVFAFYYETVEADGSRVQHYESELEVTFPATEADGSDQGTSMEQRISVYVKSDDDRSFLSAFEKTKLQFALIQAGATTPEQFQALNFELVSQETDVSMTGPEMMAEDQAKWGASSTDIQNLYREASNAYFLSAYSQISNPLDLTSATNDRLKGFEKEQEAYLLQEKLAKENYVVGNSLDNHKCSCFKYYDFNHINSHLLYIPLLSSLSNRIKDVSRC